MVGVGGVPARVGSREVRLEILGARRRFSCSRFLKFSSVSFDKAGGRANAASIGSEAIVNVRGKWWGEKCKKNT